MERISRRYFLQVTGIALLGRSLAFHAFPESSRDILFGRTLTAAPVHRTDGVVVTTLWHNSVVRILDADARRYRTPTGFIARAQVQPMVIQPPLAAMPELPFYAEVSGPAAAVRAACAADADQIASVGHGGVLCVLTRLPDGSGGVEWYGVADEADRFIGWTQASAWRPIVPFEFNPHLTRLEVDRAAQQLAAFEDDNPIMSAPMSTGRALQPGNYPLSARQPFGRCAPYDGVPWQTCFEGGLRLTGVYWHNQFGSAAAAGPDLQTSPLLARWLYHGLRDDAALIIR